MQKTFLRNLQIGFSLSLVVLIISSVASFISIRQLQNSNAMVAHTKDVLDASDKILSDLKDAETGQRGYLLTGKESFLEPYYSGLKSLPGSLKVAIDLTQDNPVQTQRFEELSSIIDIRLNVLTKLVEDKKFGRSYVEADLEIGRQAMEKSRKIINEIKDTENALLIERTASVHRFSNYTTILIVSAAIIAILITFFFYLRVRNDFVERDNLRLSLKKKDEDITKRIHLIQDVASQISEGKYDIRLNDDEKDGLGSLATSLNIMAEALQKAFTILNDNEWLQKGIATLNEKLVGNKTLELIAHDTLNHLVSYGECNSGALYLMENGLLTLQSAYGLDERMLKPVKSGEGMIGQVFANGKEKLFSNISDENYTVSFANGKIKVQHILLVPILYDDKAIGVIELGCCHSFNEIEIAFFKDATKNLGIAIAAAATRKHVQRLLEETQAQSEEMQAQHTELENLNAELEAQTQKLQASEEELKVQQEELLQANQELEERSKLLEEKNLLIVERNSEIQQKAEELALSTKYKSEFLANMSHELRTPLNSILLLSRLLTENNEKNLTEEQIESAKVILSSGTGLLTLIDEILDLSKIEAGKMNLDFHETDIIELMSSLEAIFNPLAKEKNIALRLKLDQEAPQKIITDKLRLDQILKNLISNAIKFTHEGYVNLTIQNHPKQNGFLQFIVEDTGIGIPKEQQRLIFEAFQQADGSTKRKYGGTGLGLSISRELSRLLGGSICLISEEEKGSKFILEIPAHGKTESVTPNTIPTVSYPHEDNLFNTTESIYVSQTIPNEIADDRNNINPGDKTILIVEDDTAFASLLLKFTRKQQYKGIVIVRGDLAVEFAEKYQPLAILLDIQLPVKDGWMVMEELKSNPKTKPIPVHIMSSLEVKRESLLKGAIDFINKPIALEQMQTIFHKIEDALNRHPKKVLIIEENPKHATALSYFLSSYEISTEIKTNVKDSIKALTSDKVDCIILDMGIPDQTGYAALEIIKKNEGLEHLPIIIFTGKNLSKAEEIKIKQYADSIVIKTAHSYQRILDEVGLFLHLVEEKKTDNQKKKTNTLGTLNEVLKGKTVLIADDDVRNIFSLTKALEKYQMKVISATDGKDALEQLEQHPDIAIVLMDMMMPEMDGYETTSRIRKHPKFKNIPIMAVTAKAMMGDREKCITAGASDYISKPVDIDQLLSLLRVWLYQY
ncbi:response regulator [Pedobacter glucosidilyticus]|uniref:response regulator n=1 Tax=Pedobacter glucosidilyticus TaxID=1122941 RepID=UPI00047E6C4E|nr:response regulator [Pedobacter glucosidilyticus]